MNSKKLFLVVIVLIICLLSSFSLALVPQSKDFYVNDTANVLNDDLEKYIINTNVDLYSKTGAQVCVVTVNNLEGQSIEEYATALFRQYRNRKQRKKQWYIIVVKC